MKLHRFYQFIIRLALLSASYYLSQSLFQLSWDFLSHNEIIQDQRMNTSIMVEIRVLSLNDFFEHGESRH